MDLRLILMDLMGQEVVVLKEEPGAFFKLALLCEVVKLVLLNLHISCGGEQQFFVSYLSSVFFGPTSSFSFIFPSHIVFMQTASIWPSTVESSSSSSSSQIHLQQTSGYIPLMKINLIICGTG